MPSLPSVSVIVPVLNELERIDDCLGTLVGQDYQGDVEILVADGGSTDGTLEAIDRWIEKGHPIVVHHNHEKRQSQGVNLLASLSASELLVRADAHSTYEPDFVSASVQSLLESEAVAVGGPMRAEGSTSFGRAVAQAMSSPLAIGPAKFHHATERSEADTVYLGCFRRTDFLTVGGYRDLPFGVAEDADLYFRWRRAGRTLMLDPAIRSTYRPRQRPGSLFTQFYRYGAGKADMLFVNGRWPSWRPLAPLVLVVALAMSLILAISGVFQWPLWSLLAAWLLALLAAGSGAGSISGRLTVAAAAGIMHLSYGLGLLRGLLRRPSSVRAQVE